MKIKQFEPKKALFINGKPYLDLVSIQLQI
jgi:hypothetical protein